MAESSRGQPGSRAEFDRGYTETWRSSGWWTSLTLLGGLSVLPVGLFAMFGTVLLVAELPGRLAAAPPGRSLAQELGVSGVALLSSLVLLRLGGRALLDVLGATRGLEGRVTNLGRSAGPRGSSRHWVEIAGERVEVSAGLKERFRLGVHVRLTLRRHTRLPLALATRADEPGQA